MEYIKVRCVPIFKIDYHLERRYGTFQRIIDLPDDVDENNIKATYKEGILEINLTKKEKSNREEKRIKIE